MRFGTRKRGKARHGWSLLVVCALPNNQKTIKNKIWRGGTREVIRVTGAHRGCVMRAKAPHKNRQKETQAKKQTERKRENRQQAQTYLRNTQNAMHNLRQKKTNNKQKQCKQHSQRRINTFFSQGQRTRKRRKTKNTQKQQKNTEKTKARKQAAKTVALFVLAKPLQVQKKFSEHTKRQQKMFINDKQPPNKPQKPERAPERQNSTVRPTLASPNTLPTNQRKFSVSI